MKILVVRHGETEWNRKNMILGRTDIPLSETGILQAKKLKDNIPYEFSHVVASPLKRTAMTAKIICENRNVDIKYDDRLIEMNFGIFEGKDRKDEMFQKEKRNFFTRFPQGESYFQVAQRVYNCLDEIIERYAGENVLIVTHNGICRVLHTYFKDVGNEEFAKYGIENCEVVVYEI